MTDADPDYPAMIAPVNHVEPAPRRVRAMLGGEAVFDTTSAAYVWEWPNYPWCYIPLADIGGDFLVDEDHPQQVPQGAAPALMPCVRPGTCGSSLTPWFWPSQRRR